MLASPFYPCRIRAKLPLIWVETMTTKNERLACSPGTSEEKLWAIAQDDDEIAELVGANPAAGPNLLDRLYSHMSSESFNVKAAANAVLLNGRAGPELVARVLIDLPDVVKPSWEGRDVNYPEETDLQVLLAKHPSTPADAIVQLAASPLYMVRERVAMRSDLSPDLYQLLSKDAVNHVRRNVAANVGTPPQVLDELCQDVDPSVRFRVALNEVTSNVTFERLEQDAFEPVRLAASSRPRGKGEGGYGWGGG
jgi:hypothetical protein